MSRGSNPSKIQEWTERLLRFRNSGLTVVEFCDREGVSTPSFYQWKRKLGEQADSSASPSSGQSSGRQRPPENSGFTPVRVTAARELRASEPALTVRLSGEVRIEVADNLAAIQAVMHELIRAQADGEVEAC